MTEEVFGHAVVRDRGNDVRNHRFYPIGRTSMTSELRLRPARNAPDDLRDWLANLAARGDLSVTRENVALVDELAAVAKRMERDKAVLFPRPSGHAFPVVVNLFTQRAWVADALGVNEDQLLPHFLAAARNPLIGRAGSRVTSASCTQSSASALCEMIWRGTLKNRGDHNATPARGPRPCTSRRPRRTRPSNG